MKIKRIISVLCALLIMIAMPLNAYAAVIDHDMTMGSLDIKLNGENYEYTYYQASGEAQSGSSAKSEGLEVNVGQSGEEATTNRIVVGDGVDVTLVLTDVHILVESPGLYDENGDLVLDEWGDPVYVGEEYDPHGIELGNGDVTIVLNGDNSVGTHEGFNYSAAIHVHDGDLTITSETGGTLDAYYDEFLYTRTSVIGTDPDENLTGSITINGNAEVNAYNGEHGAAIGSWDEVSGDITIGGDAKVSAHSFDDTALGGVEVSGTITIQDNAVVTSYSSRSAGIGASTMTGSIIIKDNAKVLAASGGDTGLGAYNLHGDIIIEGEAQVVAVNFNSGAGIGSSGAAIYGEQDGVMGGDIIIRDNAKVYAQGALVGIGAAGAMRGDIIISDTADVTAVGGLVAIGSLQELYSSALCSWCKGTDVCMYCSGDGECDSCDNSGVCAACDGTGDCEDCDGVVYCSDCSYHEWDEGYGYCSECHGLKECYACDGVGACDYCYGDGKCGSCNGTLVCGHCDYPQGEEYDCPEPGMCELCYGDGNCDSCDGTGKHYACNGTGIRECYDCGSTGVCSECDGTLQRGCYSCRGDGTCHTCGGSEIYDCRSCDGTGDMECETCYGDGECHTCGGSEFYMCWSCYGKGYEECWDCWGDGCEECNYVGYTDEPCWSCDGQGMRVCSCGGSNECTSCGGDGLETCWSCEGEGKRNCSCGGSNICTSCSGTGKEDCYYCNEGRCSSCDGKGSYTCYCVEEIGAGKCYDCEGSGNCYECEGTGFCRYCGGSLQCTECELTGICLECEGDGLCDVCLNTNVCNNCNNTGRCPNEIHCKSCLGTGHCLDCSGSAVCRHCYDEGYCGYCGGEGTCSHCRGTLYCIKECCYDGSTGEVVGGDIIVMDDAILRTAGQLPVGPAHSGHYGALDDIEQSVDEFGKDYDTTTLPEIPELPEFEDSAIGIGGIEIPVDWDKLKAINIEGYYDSAEDMWYLVSADTPISDELVETVKDICAENGVGMDRVVIFGKEDPDKGGEEEEVVVSPPTGGGRSGYIIWNEIEDISAIFSVDESYPKNRIASFLKEEELKADFEQLLLGGLDESRILRFCHVWDDTDMGIRMTMRFHVDKSYIGESVEIRWVENGELKTFETTVVEDEMGRGMAVMDRAPMGDYVVVLK